MTSDLIVDTDAHAGRIRLNRPKALRALTTAMCGSMLETLEAWRGDEAVEIVLIDRAPAPDGDPKSSRRVCAGGNIRMPDGQEWTP